MPTDDIMIPDGSLLGFPVTPYLPDGHLDLDRFCFQVEMLLSYGARAVFVGCGTGEAQCLLPSEHEQLVEAAVSVAGATPTFGAAGFGLDGSVDLAERAATAGAAAMLAFPPYLPVRSQDGIRDYYLALADRSPLPIVPYQRDGITFSTATLRRLADHPKVIGMKDGTGIVEVLQHQVAALAGEEFFFFNGTPTAELFAPALAAIGVKSYSSALLNFVPEFAEAFNRAFLADEVAEVQRLVRDIVVPFVELRDRQVGYAVSLVKEGVSLRGESVGPTRTPFPQPTEQDRSDLELWLKQLELDGPLQIRTGDDALWPSKKGA